MIVEEITIEETQEVNNDNGLLILNNITNILNGVTVEPNFPCYCDTCDTYEKVVGLLLKSVDTKGKRSDSKAKRHGLLTNETLLFSKIEQPYY